MRRLQAVFGWLAGMARRGSTQEEVSGMCPSPGDTKKCRCGGTMVWQLGAWRCLNPNHYQLI